MSRVFRKHHVSTAMRPHQTLRNMLVHPKDKQELENKCEVVYKFHVKTVIKFILEKLGENLGHD